MTTILVICARSIYSIWQVFLSIYFDNFLCHFFVCFPLPRVSPHRGFFRSHSTPHAQFSLRHLPISFRFGFSHLLFSPQTHAMGFSSRFLPHTPSFLSSTRLLASSLGFLAYFSLSTPTTWFFPLVSYSSRPVFSPLPINQLPGWVFTLVFLFLHPQRGFLRLQTPAHTNLIKCI